MSKSGGGAGSGGRLTTLIGQGRSGVAREDGLVFNGDDFQNLYDSDLRAKYLSPDSVAWAKGLTNSEVRILENYTANGYETYNNGLRSGKALPEGIALDVATLDSAIRKSVMPYKAVVWRGIDLFDDSPLIHQLKPGADFTDKGYVSTSLKHDFAAGRAISMTSTYGNQPYLFKINMPKGSQAAHVEAHYFNKYGDSVGEWEVLLPRNSRFKIKSVAKQDVTLKYSPHIPNPMTVVEMDYLGPGGAK